VCALKSTCCRSWQSRQLQQQKSYTADHLLVAGTHRCCSNETRSRCRGRFFPGRPRPFSGCCASLLPGKRNQDFFKKNKQTEIEITSVEARISDTFRCREVSSQEFTSNLRTPESNKIANFFYQDANAITSYLKLKLAALQCFSFTKASRQRQIKATQETNIKQESCANTCCTWRIIMSVVGACNAWRRFE